MLPNTKWPNILKISPKWQNFAKSGHPARKPHGKAPQMLPKRNLQKDTIWEQINLAKEEQQKWAIPGLFLIHLWSISNKHNNLCNKIM